MGVSFRYHSERKRMREKHPFICCQEVKEEEEEEKKEEGGGGGRNGKEK